MISIHDFLLHFLDEEKTIGRQDEKEQLRFCLSVSWNLQFLMISNE